MKLISMREFVLEIEKTPIDETDWVKFNKKNLDKIFSYAEFLSQPLTLGIFVPTDLEGNVLEEPKQPDKSDMWNDPALDSQTWANYQFQKDEYRKAKDRVLFDGFEMHRNGKYVVDVLDNPIYFNVGFGWTLYGGGRYTNVESLMSRNVTLTQQAIKQIAG